MCLGNARGRDCRKQRACRRRIQWRCVFESVRWCRLREDTCELIVGWKITATYAYLGIFRLAVSYDDSSTFSVSSACTGTVVLLFLVLPGFFFVIPALIRGVFFNGTLAETRRR